MDPITLQQILNQLAAADGDVAALLSGEAGQTTDLAALETEAVAAFDALRGRDSLTEPDVDQLETLADAVEAIRTERGRRDEQAAETRTRADELAGRVTPPAASEPAEPEEGEQPAEGTEPAAPGDTPAGDPAGQPPAGADPAANPTAAQPAGQPASQPASEPDLVPVAASARRRRAPVNLAQIAQNRPQPPAPAGQQQNAGGRLLAAAEVPGTTVGSEFGSWSDVARAAVTRFGAMPARGSHAQVRQGLLVIEKTPPEALVADGANDMEAIEYAASEHRLQGNSLVAAGGWCAPSETLYDLLELESTDGLIDLPEVVAARGGVRWTTGPDFSAIYSGAGFLQTETQAIAGTAKTCYEVPCPDFDEARLDAIGVCISAGILQNRAYPELVQRVLRGAMTVHAHKYSASSIDRMETGSTAVTVVGGPGATATVLGAVELQAVDYRTLFRMPDTATLEVVLPRWIRGVLRSDLAKRNGVDLISVTDATIISHFAARGVRVQFVYGWQDAFVDAGAGLGGAAPATAWPTSVKFMIYAAGTWVRLTADIITLDAVYDSVNFKVNKYNALFTEEGLNVIKRGFDSRVVTLDICPDGATGAQVAVDCATTPVA